MSEIESSGLSPEEIGESQKNGEVKESQEFELSTEIEEGVMEKVQDINKYGIGYSVVRSKQPRALENIFTNGMLPPVHAGEFIETESGIIEKPHSEDVIDQRKEYVEFAKSKDKSMAWLKNINIWFNIVGRSSDITTGEDIKNAFWHNQGRAGDVIIFNLKGLKELPWGEDLGPTLIRKFGSLWNSYTSEEALRSMHTNEEDKVNSEYSFALHGRITPRQLEGIVTKGVTSFEIPEKWQKEKTEEYLAERKKYKKRYYSYLVEPMVKTNRFLPIYDYEGNLRWPKRMSYEQVKQLVAEREARKREQEEINGKG